MFQTGKNIILFLYDDLIMKQEKNDEKIEQKEEERKNKQSKVFSFHKLPLYCTVSQNTSRQREKKISNRENNPLDGVHFTENHFFFSKFVFHDLIFFYVKIVTDFLS